MVAQRLLNKIQSSGVTYKTHNLNRSFRQLLRRDQSLIPLFFCSFIKAGNGSALCDADR
jgi:hypothetical protein